MGFCKFHSLTTQRVFASLAMAALVASGLAQKLPTKEFTNGKNLSKFETVVPEIAREMRAFWVTTVFNLDWPSNTTRTTAQQQAEARAFLDACVDLKMNVVCVQIRSQADALYNTSLEPYGPMFRGSFGLAPSPAYDPLQYWIDQAKLRGIQVYAWVNPYRALSNATSTVPSNHIKNQAGMTDLYPTSATNNSLWIDPSGPGSNWTRNVINDVVTRYDIDGLIFDDYFYPYPYNSVDYPDADAYSAYTSGGGTLSKKEWRIKNINDFVQNVNLDVKAIKPYMKFGVSPSGIYRSSNASSADGRPKLPSPITGFSHVDSLYADSVKWMQSGWIDFIAPQIYWSLSSTAQNHTTIMNWWSQQNTLNRLVYVANAAYLVADGTWSDSELNNQITATRNLPTDSGNIHFRTESIVQDVSLTAALKAGAYANPAILPAHPWIENIPPANPWLVYSLNSSNHVFNWTIVGEPAYQIVVATLVGSTWTHQVLPGTTTSFTFPRKNAGGPLRAIGVQAIDRNFNASKWSQQILDPTVISGGNVRN